ncbi:MAG: hypothetical protein ABJE95_33950 [Byssovorax sp.]
MSDPAADPAADRAPGATTELPCGVLRVRLGPGANCSSAGSAIDVLFYGSVLIGALAVALAAAFPPRDPEAAEAPAGDDPEAPPPAAQR